MATMSHLMALNFDLDMSMLPVSALPWRAELLKFPAHGMHYEHLAVPMEEVEHPHGVESGGLAGDGFTDWMTERVDISTFLPATMDPSLSNPQAPDLETMTTLLKKELEQMEDYFLEESLSPGLPMVPDQVAPSTPPSGEIHFQFPSHEPVPGGRHGEFQALMAVVEATASAVACTTAPLETLDSGCLDLLNLYCNVPGEFQREDLQDFSDLSNHGDTDPPAQTKRGIHWPTPYDRMSSSDTCSVASTSSTPQKGDRKQKKRDQNKTAALRYRQRKRAEYDALDEECQGLEVRNRELKEKSDSIEREIQYVKDLLIEVYKARSQRLRNN
ncbi:cyclic AMP-dependent transcription factor ATF-5 [Ambystoma mexicanum]|uniref:cyclic AMP-dependent transcription factor ATF-5 n=1 Tax=Ambystoma mexicanum TaxID=8296 RepID=UPI0037E823D5